eukprot:gene27382-9682_t
MRGADAALWATLNRTLPALRDHARLAVVLGNGVCEQRGAGCERFWNPDPLPAHIRDWPPPSHETVILQHNHVVRQWALAHSLLYREDMGKCNMHGQDIFMMIDGGTLVQKRTLNIMLGCDGDGEVFFYKSIRIPNGKGDTLEAILENEIATLANYKIDGTDETLHIHTFCLVSDNCQAYINAIESFQQAPLQPLTRGCRKGLTQPDEDEHEEVIDLAHRRGLFAIRCALQLVLKDFEENIPVVKSACDTIDKVLEVFGKSPESKEELRDAQRTLGVDKPLELIRPGKTRWNSKIDAWRRLLILRTAIAAAGHTIRAEAWRSITKSIALCAAFGVATNKLQGDDVDTTMLCDELDELNEHLKGLTEDEAMKPTAEKAIPIFEERLKSNFDNDLRKVHKLFRPDVDQEKMDDDERTEALRLAHRYGKFHAQRHGWEWDEDKIEIHLSNFMSIKDRGGKSYNEYWRPKRLTMVALASFALSVGRCMVTEASVERSYSKEGRILTALRNNLNENTTN